MVFQSTLPRRERLHSRSIHLCLLYFNPRSREGSDAFFTNFACSAIRFQSTLPRRERPGLGRRRLWLGNFNPRSREGSDILADALGILTVTISIHAPAKGATSIQSCRYDNRTDFNPRSREGSDTARNGLPPRITISIHAPAKGATVMRQTLGYDMTFQSTLPRRERRLVAAVVLNRVISIHAPAKGATLLSVYQPPRNHYFNPRSREGSDRWGRRIFLMAFKFQSTLPRRERLTRAGFLYLGQ